MDQIKRPFWPAWFILLALSGACAVKKAEVRPELLSGPGYTLQDNNLHQLEGPAPGKDSPMAFRVYRSGSPSKETFAKWCSEYKIKRVIDLAGSAQDNEKKYQQDGLCPDIEIIFSEKLDPAVPLTKEFLQSFDREIERAKQDGVGILFRCSTGSHRAGRMAAYYQMKYQGLEPDEAIAVMDYNGMMMPAFDPVLQPQVRALHDYVHGRPCSQAAQYCVK
jgi:protein-tyrosine phosphatase